MDKIDWLNIWLESKIHEAIMNKEEFFLSRPDKWYEEPTWVCENLHISDHYLKSEERGDLCLECRKKVRLCPPDTTEKSIAKEISDLKRENKLKRIIK